MRVHAKRLGWDEKLTPEQEFDLDPYEAGDDDLTGVLEVVDVPETDDFPGVKVYLVGGQEADPDTIKPARAGTPFRPSLKSLTRFRTKDQGAPCKPGETAARSGCIPASGEAPSRPGVQQQQKPQPRQQTGYYAEAPEGESLTEPPCCLHDADPAEVDEATGVGKAARVGVPGMEAPPPPKEIPRLRNLTEKERAAETRFADAFLADPDGMADFYREQLKAGKVGDAPNVFNTDDAKLLSPDYNPDGEDAAVKDARGTYNLAVHQTANAVAKRAFLRHLDEVVAGLPEDQKVVLVTSGGVASGKGYALKNAPGTSDLATKVGAIWDAAGEQNATENPWVLEECRKRGIKTIFAYVHADPASTWENPARGVVERAGKIGRMVDAQAFADSYAYGAKNFKAFMDANKDGDGVQFFCINNAAEGGPRVEEGVPEAALAVDADELYARASAVLDERKDKLKPAVYRGGSVGRRVWGKPRGTQP